jgi:glycopeptide antibiotics resistance protein
VVTQISLLLAVMHSNWRQGLRVIVFATCGYIAYEFAQLVLPQGTFDMKDVTATLAGGAIAVGILSLARRFAGDRVVAGS